MKVVVKLVAIDAAPVAAVAVVVGAVVKLAAAVAAPIVQSEMSGVTSV